MGVRRWIGSGVVAATLVTLGACTPDDGGEKTPAACSTPPTLIASAQPAGVGAGALRVAESGYTQLGPNKTVVSIGAILENTGEQVAYRARVTFKATAAGGVSAVPAGSGELLSQEIPVILPRQKIPVGAWTYVEGQVTAVNVEVTSAMWVARDASFAEITTGFQALARTATDPETASVTYKMISGYCRELTPRGVAMVFRDGGGKIVGGSFELGAEKCPPGESTQRSTAQRSAPAGINDASTQVHPYCDFAPATAPKSNGGPVN